MGELFRIETDRSLLIWSGPAISLDSLSFNPSNTPGRLAVKLRRTGANRIVKRFIENAPTQISEHVDSEIGPHLLEETQYKVLLRSKVAEEIEMKHRDPLIIKDLSKDDRGRVLYGGINFGGQIGRSQFKVSVGDKPEFDFEVEVFPSKLDYSSDYEALLADLQDITAALVLEYLQATFQLGFTTREAVPTRLEWLSLLRHVFNDLERGLRYIERHPQRELSRERLPTRVERLQKSDAAIFRYVMQGKGAGQRVRMRNGLPVRSKLPENRALPTLDTQEHRWLAAQLAQIRKRLTEIYEEEKRRARVADEAGFSARREQILGEINSLKGHINRLEAIEPIAAATGLPAPGFVSLKLQKAPGYREAYHACIKLRLGLRIGGGGLSLSLKQLYTLYEYWCYLSIIRMVARVLGVRVPVERLLRIQQNGIHVQLQKGRVQRIPFTIDESRRIEVTYNPTFSGASYVLPQKPDIVITLHDSEWPEVKLILDAKYRIDNSAKYLEQFGAPGPPLDAINVLHRYRDAILEETNTDEARSDRFKRTVVEGVALFPYVDRDKEFGESRLWKSLERLGIGALPFLPSEMNHVEQWLRSILRQGGWSIAERAIPHVTYEKLRSWREASKEVVLVGTLRREAHTHLDWIVNESCYYTPLTHTQRLQFAVRWLAIYTPASLQRPGAVTHYAPVERIDVIRRKEIQTPWEPGRDGDELQVVYYLGQIEKLTPTIKNKGENGRGTRFSRNRWTSLLALQRAREVRELFLETEPEWRLYDELKATGINFTTIPGRPTGKEEDDPRGRTSFVIDDVVVQYKGSAGFLIRHASLGDEYQSTVEGTFDRVKSFRPAKEKRSL